MSCDDKGFQDFSPGRANTMNDNSLVEQKG